MHDVQPLRVGVAGLGWAGETHIKAYQRVPGVEVVAIADKDPERRARIGRERGIQDRYEDYRGLTSREDIDAVSVCTPNHLHAPAAISAIRSGKHVLSEKPLARSGAEAEPIVQAATDMGRVLHVAFSQRVRDDVRVLKQYIENGDLGRIYHIKASWMRRNGIPGVGSWFTNKEMAGGGPLIDLGVHILDMALYLLGDPEIATVSAATYAELGPRGRGGWADDKAQVSPTYEVEDLATAFIRLVDGATLALETSWAVYGDHGDDFGLVLYGTEGGAEMTVKNYDWRDTLRIFTDHAGVPVEVRPHLKPNEGHLEVVAGFVDAIGRGDHSNRSGEEGLNRARVIDGCYASALEGREVSFNEPAVRLSS